MRIRLASAALLALATLATASIAGAQDMPQCVRDPNTGRWISPVEGKACSLRPSSTAPAPSPASTAFLVGVQAGNALNEWTKASQARARARRTQDSLARVERERVAASEAARKRDEVWGRLSQELRFSTSASLDMRLDNTANDLKLRFDGDTARGELSDAELMARDRNNCFFGDCSEKYEAGADVWAVPYVDLRHLVRAAQLVRRTLTAPGDQRESLMDQAMVTAQGGLDDKPIQEDGVVLPPNALDVMQHVSVEHKLATEARLAAESDVALLQQRRDFVSGLADAAQRDASVSLAGRNEALRRIATELASVDAQIADAGAKVRVARSAEDALKRRERNTLLGLTARDTPGGGPVEDCAHEQEAIDRIRAGFTKLDETIAKEEAIAAEEHADSRASIQVAKDASKPGLDPLKQAIGPYLRSVSVQLRSVALAGQPRDRLKLLARAKRAKELFDEWESAGTQTGERIGKALAATDAPLPDDPSQAAMEILQRMDDAGLLSPLAEGLAGAPAVAALELGPYVALGDALIRTSIATTDAVLADQRARVARSLAAGMREQRRHLQDLVAERESRLGEIQRAGGCIAAVP